MNKAYYLLLFGLFVMPAQADLLKCVDNAGHVSYGEKAVKGQTCSAVTATVNVVPALKVPAASANSQAQAQSARTQLENQIAAQEAALAEAQKALTEQENIRLGGEANYQRVLDRLQPYQAKVAEIQKNLDQLKSDLARLP